VILQALAARLLDLSQAADDRLIPLIRS